MSTSIIQSRLDTYGCKTAQDEENAIREIAQEVVLSGLSRAGFFKNAAFLGGTCLRIIYGLERFSEDLDFSLFKPDKNFELKNYLDYLCAELKLYGFEFTLKSRGETDSTVQKDFIKDDSIVNLITFKHFKPGMDTRSIKIKLEIDTNPPQGADVEVKFLDYPFAYETSVHTPGSLFAGKCHALLCREYVKGRDWYDFTWYASRKTRINFSLLAASIEQSGPWKGKGINADKNWCLENLKKRIDEIDWNDAKKEIKRFIKPHELPSIELWSAGFFNDILNKIRQYM